MKDNGKHYAVPRSMKGSLVCSALLVSVAFTTTSLILMLLVATSRAGDIASQPADSLTVTNSVNNLLPQPASPPAPGGEESWLSGLHISGYGSQTFGMWQNPTTLKQYTRSRNNLAVARSLLQVDENYRLNENNTFFMREWFAYEPPYSFNSANNPFWAAATRISGSTAATSANAFCFTNTFCRDTASHGSSFGHHINGVYNTYQVRDAWWENKTGPLTTFIGNQIVVWGQSLIFCPSRLTHCLFDPRLLIFTVRVD